MAILKYEPFREFVSLRDAMNSLFEDSFVRGNRLFGALDGARSFPVDIYQTENELVVRAAVPGVKPEDTSITVLNGVLTLKGETKAEAADGQFLRQELTYSSFERSFELPFEVQADKAEARFEHGILTIKLPKAEQAKPKQIQIKVASPVIEGEKR
ncbi:MAG: Hsp20/alpha crystallin family protein [Chloroflexota bacterium]|nr:Hsp20/alpha crystallin family protein [Chloroflexota bacterium]